MAKFELNLSDYLFILRKRRLIILAIFFAIFTSVVFYTNTQPKIYRTQTTVKIIERKTLAGLMTEYFAYTPGDPVASQAKAINSYPVIERVVKELGLVKEGSLKEEILQAVISIQNMVSTEVIQGTNIIRIIVEDTDPMRVATVANKITETFIDENLREKNRQARKVRVFIQARLEELSVKLKSSEDALEEFKKSGAATGIAIPVQNRLADLAMEKAKLLRNYTELHPDIIKIKGEEESLKEQMQQLPQSEIQYARLMRDFEINEKLYRNLKDKFEEARIAEIEKVADVSLVDPAPVPKFPMSPNKSLNYLLGVVLGLMLGLTGGLVVEQLDTSIGTVEDVESYIGLPILGVIPFSPLEEKKRNVFPLFHREKDKLSATKNRLIIYSSIQSSIIEAYHMLDTNLWSTFEEKALPKIIVITSTAPGEGKTIISANLAITMAQRGVRTLLIDADLRRPVLYRLFGLKRESGLSEVLSNTLKLKDALRGFTDLFLGLKQQESLLKMPGLNNLQFITPGHLPNNPVGLFASERMSILMDELRKNFDIVIFDSPPILPVSDVSILAPKADAVILVYQVGKTSRSALQRSKKQLESVGAKLKGIVLNCLNPQVEMNRSYYYYRHYRYYGKKEEKDV